jgi:hypothetical protein
MKSVDRIVILPLVAMLLISLMLATLVLCTQCTFLLHCDASYYVMMNNSNAQADAVIPISRITAKLMNDNPTEISTVIYI